MDYGVITFTILIYYYSSTKEEEHKSQRKGLVRKVIKGTRAYKKLEI